MPGLSDFVGAAPPKGATTVQGNGAMKATIILVDTLQGSRNFTVPPDVSKLRVAVVGGGGGEQQGVVRGEQGVEGGMQNTYYLPPQDQFMLIQ